MTSIPIPAHPAGATPRRALPSLAAVLLDPPAAVRDPSARRSMRLLAGLSGVLTLTCVQGALANWLTMATDNRHTLALALGIAGLGYAFAYCLARSGHARAATLLCIVVQMALPLSLLELMDERDTHGVVTSTLWLTLALLTASILASQRWIAITGAAATAGLVATVLATGSPPAELAHTTIYLLTLTVLLILYARHRDAIEKVRRGELEQHVAALDQLRRELEDRVTARTAELAQACTTLKCNQETMLRVEKLAAVGRLTAGFAHEMNSPLSAVAAALVETGALVEEYRRSVGDDDVLPEDHHAIAGDMQRSIETAKTATERALGFVRGMRAQTRHAGPASHERFDAVAIVRDALQLLSHAARANRCAIAFHSDEPAVALYGPPSRLAQAVNNLACNAIDAVGEVGGGRLDVHLSRDARGVALSFEDNGAGIPEAVQSRIFEPLYTTKPHGKGTGLGLSIVHEVVTGDFAGEIALTSDGRGATFTLHLPAKTAPHGT